MISPIPGRLAVTLLPVLFGTTACPASAQVVASGPAPVVIDAGTSGTIQTQSESRRAPSRAARRSQPSAPRDRVGAANAAARVQPDGEQFINAIQNYAWAPGALYQVYAAPGTGDRHCAAGRRATGWRRTGRCW